MLKGFLRSVLVTQANGKTSLTAQNDFGELERSERDGMTQSVLRRDERGRIIGLRTPDREISLAYDEDSDALARIDGLKEPIEFSDFNHLGQPKRADIGNGRIVMDLEYHAGGRLRCLTQKRKGGLSTRRTYNAYGDLSEIKRGNQPAVSYSHKGWGSVASMSYKGNAYSVFGDGSAQKLNFPGDVTADIDAKSRLIEVQRPGLALKEMSYSDDDQLDQVFFGGELLRDYDYQHGDLQEIRAINPDGTEDLYVYSYDENGRLSSIEENGAALAGFTYPDLTGLSSRDPDDKWGDSRRILTYTDGNGVVYSYDYDRYGAVRSIELSDGPTFYYQRDEGGNLLELQAAGMRVQYEGWQEGLPSTMRWGDGTEFTIERDNDNNLQRIAEGGDIFVLDLTWRAESSAGDPCAEGAGGDKRLQSVLRKAGTFSETLTPSYNEEEHLTGVQIARNSNGVHDLIEENYGTVRNQLLGGLTRMLNNQKLVDELLQSEAGADNRRIHQRVGQVGAATSAGIDQYSYDPILGNLSKIDRRDGSVRTFVWDGFRRLREIRDDGTVTAAYRYDHRQRRIRAATQQNQKPLAFAYDGSKVIAIGLYEGPGQVQWTHAIGQGALGPAFIKDLTGAGHDYYILCDHLGTPLAYKNTHAGTVCLNPISPWGESLANAPTRGSPYNNQNFELPPDAVFPTVPLGVAGHLHDADTGLIYMHHRYYDPQLGHFLNPDFRAPDIFDPSTFTEPYTYAAGNPMMFWDPNGLKSISFEIKGTNYGMTFSDKEWEEMVLEFSGLTKVYKQYDTQSTRNELSITNFSEYSAYQKEFARQSRILEGLVVDRFKANALGITISVERIIKFELDKARAHERAKIFAYLNSVGALPYLASANFIGKEYAQEATWQLVPHEVDFYLNHQLSQDLETAGKSKLLADW